MTMPIEREVERVIDQRVITLTVRGAPLVSKPHRDSVRIIPETITLTFTSESDALDYEPDYGVSRIEVEGARARRNGAPGTSRSTVIYYLYSILDHPEEWLTRLAPEYAP